MDFVIPDIMTISSQYQGKCKGFKNNDGTMTVHNWGVGDQIFYQRDPKCICINESCFNQQQQATGGVQSASTGSTTDMKAKITRSTDERAIDLGVFISTCANANIELKGSDVAQVWCRL